MIRRVALRVAVLGALVGVGGVAGCGLLFQESDPPAPGTDPRTAAAPRTDPEATPPRGTTEPSLLPGEALPGGLGTLRQEQVAVRLRRGGLELFVVPLDEGVTRTTAPDTWERLSALAQTHRAWFRERTGSDTPYPLFLVALYTELEPLPFVADELAVVSGGIRLRPIMHRGLSPQWERGRVLPGDPLLAVYAFPPEALLEPDLEVEYQEVRSRDWSRILPVVQAEQARIRARSGPGA
jgi:hypothetical protein